MVNNTAQKKGAFVSVGILIPLKSKQVSKNWNTTCLSLAKTIASLENQTNTQFDFMVVGHEPPDFISTKTWHGQSVFHSIEEVVPPASSGATQHDYTIDKNSKITKALMLLKKRNSAIKLWFALDADDLAHKDLVDTVCQLNEPAGVILNHGYLFYPQSNRVIKTDQFSMYCGSSGMIADKYINCPAEFDINTMKQIPFCRYSHMGLDAFFRNEIKQPFVSPDKALVTYILSHGDNISDDYRGSLMSRVKAWLKPYIKGRAPSQKFKEEFGLELK
jgi:hypothetical protein